MSHVAPISGPIVRGASLLALLIVAAGCAARRAPRAADHPELAALYGADQADRRGPWDTTLAAARAQMERDAARRARVQALVAASAARTAADHYHAAMVLQHGGDSTAYRAAHDLARRAVALDPTHAPARWLVAAAWDRYQLSIGRPQWYGTQGACDLATGRAAMQAIDTTRVTDAERVRLGVRPLAEQRATFASRSCR
jgi:hypothetical protein